LPRLPGAIFADAHAAVASMRFRPEQHLRLAGEIRAVREQGRRLDCRAFTLWWKRREPAAASGARVCVIASTAAVGAATRRNRAKRRLREIFRRQQQHAPQSCDLLLIARAAAVDVPLSELEKKFVEACRQIEPAAKS
jgi:ribonuclease P protein component